MESGVIDIHSEFVTNNEQIRTNWNNAEIQIIKYIDLSDDKTQHIGIDSMRLEHLFGIQAWLDMRARNFSLNIDSEKAQMILCGKMKAKNGDECVDGGEGGE